MSVPLNVHLIVIDLVGIKLVDLKTFPADADVWTGEDVQQQKQLYYGPTIQAYSAVIVVKSKHCYNDDFFPFIASVEWL